MKSYILVAFLAVFFQVSVSYNFCNDNKDLLLKYNIYKQFGGDDPNKKLKIPYDVPSLSYQKPSYDNDIIQNWLLNMCGNEIDTSDDRGIDLSMYTKNSLLYGTTRLSSENIFTEVNNVLNTDLSNENVVLNELNEMFTGLNIFIKDQKKTNFNITFKCDNNLKNDEIKKVDREESFDLINREFRVSWNLELRGISGCLTNSKDNKPAPPPPASAKSHSFFLYFFIYVLLFTSIYIGATSYLEIKDGGTLQDFEDTFKRRFRELVFSIPAFSRELYNKLIGNSSNRYNPMQYSNDSNNNNNSDNRSGYAAV